MKKILITLVAVLMFGAAAIAGPMIGVSLIPTAGNTFGYSFGWQLENNWEVLATRDTLNTWIGLWGIVGLWNPPIWVDGNLKAGVGLILDWGAGGAVAYDDLYLVLGAEHWFTSLAGIYGQLNLSSVYGLTPEIGFQLRFVGLPVQIGSE